MTTSTYATLLPLATASTSGPVAQADRLQNLDMLRGVALLGILLMNIPGFALAERAFDGFRHDPHSANFWTYAVITIFFEGKMRALFSMLFGAGVVLFTLRKEQAGRPVAGLFYRRMGWLVLFGLLQAHLLLWMGDILYFYGIGGMLAFLFRKLPARYLALGVPLVAIIGFVSDTLFFQHIRATRFAYKAAQEVQHQRQPLSAAQQQAIANWQDMEKEFLPNQAEIAAHTRQMKSGYHEVAQRVRHESWLGESKYLVFTIPDVLALMLLGIALFKWGFFTGQWSQSQYLRTAAWGYGLGLPLVLWSFYLSYQRGVGVAAQVAFLESHTVVWSGLIYPAQRIALVLAHASVLLFLYRAGVGQGLMRRLAAVGQMAFTNYIMHTVFCTLIFFGYGLNYYAELQYYQLYFVVLAIWVVQLVVSPLWLKYFLFGPLEWLWRSLTYWQVQPMRRTNTEAGPVPGLVAA
ncbi:DUF418 domain-containing protein [Hymenobacter setariae]|uniref:DUF418 domain-containing protein n=1 Tax=Hymenobacter setariae TaxID=2594794 RepID=A0A558BPH7_9BACT|nr:DUF418 domain-containing protein [Hymenobacter setariae]TVT38401.1 DUF418 domain-containing protein [Hymenobacter setariae]